MQQPSRPVVTNQPGPHHDLARRVSRGLTHPLRKPIARHTQEAFASVTQWYERQTGPLILDAGCGVGLSTRQLAEKFPDHTVIGVDRSEDRLTRAHGELPANARLVRADLVDFWRLALASSWQPQRHYVLYPNPYPKSVHLKMRWHGHPVFPVIPALGGRLELRSNWRLYVEEFALALRQATGVKAAVEAFDAHGEPLTPFEDKYQRSGQSLWRLVVELPQCPELLPIA